MWEGERAIISNCTIAPYALKADLASDYFVLYSKLSHALGFVSTVTISFIFNRTCAVCLYMRSKISYFFKYFKYKSI